MSADHRKPVVAFVVLALTAVALVGVQRAEAQHGRLLAAMIAAGGGKAGVQGLLPEPSAQDQLAARARVASLGPAFEALQDDPGTGLLEAPVTLPDHPGPEGLGVATVPAEARSLPQVAGPGKTKPGKAGKSRAGKSKPGKAHKARKGKAARKTGQAGPEGRTTGKPALKRQRMTVTWSDRSTRPGARPTPGSGTSTRPSTLTRPAQARAAQRDDGLGDRGGKAPRRGR